MRFSTSLALTTIAALGWPLGAPAIDTKAALDKLGFPANAEARVRAGDFLETSLPASSERDLNIGIAFLLKKPPQEVARQLREGMLLQKVDPDTIAYGKLEGEGTNAQLQALKLTPAQVQAYSTAKPGAALNLSSEEIATLGSGSQDAAAIQGKVLELLLARYRAYRAKGLAGIAPYARGGPLGDAAGDLTATNRIVRSSGLLPMAFYELLEGYPKGVTADLDELFYWSQFKAHGEDTIALVHSLVGTFAGTLVGVQRQYYVSTGFNVEQAIAGFQPDPAGTLVIYTNHTSTDQLAGFGSGAKRSIGRRLMAGQLKTLFEKTAAVVDD